MTDRRLEIVQHLMPRVPMEYQQSIESAMKTWWANIRRDGGMRLTDLGYEMMHDVLKLENWSLDLRDGPRHVLTKKNILVMDRRLEWPYYLDVNVKRRRRHVVFFGSREAMMANMYGDLERWLKSLG